MTTDEKIDAIHAMVTELVQTHRAAPAPATASEPVTVSDADLDGKYGNPEVRKNPPRWDGPSFEGKHYSECSAAFLESLAGFLAWKAGKDDAKGTEDGKKYARFSRLDAARALGWKKRIDAGFKPPGESDDLPF